MKSADVTLTLIYPFCMLTQQSEAEKGSEIHCLNPWGCQNPRGKLTYTPNDVLGLC